MASPAARPAWRWSGSNSGRWGQRGRWEGTGQWKSEDERRKCKIHVRFPAWTSRVQSWGGNVTCRKHCGINETIIPASVTNAAYITIKHSVWPSHTTASLASIRWSSQCLTVVWRQHKGRSVSLHLSVMHFVSNWALYFWKLIEVTLTEARGQHGAETTSNACGWSCKKQTTSY